MDGFGALQINELTEGATLDAMVVTPETQNHLLSSVPAFYVSQPQPDVPVGKRRKLFGRGNCQPSMPS
jgi:hypothetical protein